MKLVAALASLLLLGAHCVAQELSADVGQPSEQNVAAAAEASRAQIKLKQAKESDIRQLLALTGGGALANQTMDGMEKNVRLLMTNSFPAGEYRERLIDLFFAKFRAKRDTQQLIELAVPIYDKYYSDDEIKQLISLYQTPLGQKMLTVMPQLVGEMQAAGQKWGEALGRQSMMEVLAEHPELEKALQEAHKTAPAQ